MPYAIRQGSLGDAMGVRRGAGVESEKWGATHFSPRGQGRTCVAAAGCTLFAFLPLFQRFSHFGGDHKKSVAKNSEMAPKAKQLSMGIIDDMTLQIKLGVSKNTFKNGISYYH